MHTPIALTLFNNPDSVQRVFERIREARPPKLFLISDAGRTPQEHALVEESRHIAEAVDWPCEVFKNYSDTNLGPKKRVSSGITWVFEHVESAIILEHDCLPDPSFFEFCEELLEKYKDDGRVMHIGGTNFQQGNRDFVCRESYYFSQVPQIWGFATWRRAWQHYDADMKQWPRIKQSGLLKSTFSDPAVLERWEYRFEQYYQGQARSWDGQWAFACLINGGLSVVPAANVVSNIGFGPQALTTKNASHGFANMPIRPISFPLTHPTIVAPNAAADAYAFKYIFDVNRTAGQRLRWFFRSRWPALYGALKRLVK